MSTCKIPTKSELDNLVDNHKALFPTKESQTAEDTVNFLKVTQEAFEKKDGKYTTESGRTLGTTITTRVGEWYKRKFPIPPTPAHAAKIDQQAKIGNTVHESIEHISKRFIQELSGMTAKQALAKMASMNYADYQSFIEKTLVDMGDKWGYTSDPSIGLNIFYGLVGKTGEYSGILGQIYGRQRALDNRTGTEGVVTIMSEAIIIDPKTDMGGTIDLVAVFSNNTAMVFDFKTKTPSNNMKADGSIEDASKLISGVDYERYKMQLGHISRILKKSYGIKHVIAARIEPIRVNVAYNKTTEKFGTKINKIAFGYNQDNALQQIAPLAESTGFSDLDSFIRGIEKRIKSLNDSAKKDKEKRDFYAQKANELEAAKRDILTFHNFNKLLEYAQRLEKEITAESVEKMDLTELRNLIGELKTMEALSEATYKYRNYMKESGKKEEDIAAFEGIVGATIAALVDKRTMLEEEMYGKRMADLIELLSGRKIRDEEGNVIPFHDEGYFGKLFNQLSQFENPVFIAFRNKLDSIQYDVRTKVNTLIEEVQSKETALFNWMDKNGKDRQWFIQTFIDQKTDNFHNKISKEFLAELNKIREENEVAKIVEYYKPNDKYLEWYTKKYAEKKNDVERQSFENEFDLSLSKSGKPNKPDAWIKALKKYHALRLKPEVEALHLSAEYKYIQSIPELAAYYEMFMKYNREFRDVLGVEYFKLPNNFIPNIRRDIVERIRDEGALIGIGSSIKDMINDLNVREDDTYFGEMEDGKLVRRIPRFFINPFTDKDTNEVKVGEKSYELGKSLILFAKMAYNYEHMQQEEAQILGMKEFLAERGTELIKKNGKHLEDLVGNKLARNLGNTDMEKIFDSFVDVYLYGISIQPAFGDESGKYEKRIMKAKEFMTLKSLGLNFVAAAGSVAAAKTNAWIEGNKGILYDKQQYTEALKESWGDRERHLALVAYFDAMNVEYENFSVTEGKRGSRQLGDPTRRGFIERYVNGRLLMRPFSYGDEFIDELITNSMAKNYYVDELGNLKRIKNETEKEKFADRTIDKLFTYTDGVAKLNLPEEQIKQVYISFRNAARAGQSKIKGTIPHEDRAYWQSQILGQVVMHYKSWFPGIMKERFGKLKYNESTLAVEMGKFIALNQEFKNIEGYAAKDFTTKILIPKLGQLLLHLTTFGKLKMNDKFRKQEAFETWLENNPQYKDIITFEDYLDIQQRQLKSLMVELRILLAFMGLIVLLGIDWDDDGQKDYKQIWLTRKIAAILFKTNQELTFNYNPVEFAKMIANPIPMISLVTDAVKTLKNTGDEFFDLIIGEERMLGGSDKDETGLFYYSHQWVPGARGVSKILDIFNQDSGDAYQ